MTGRMKKGKYIKQSRLTWNVRFGQNWHKIKKTSTDEQDVNWAYR